MVLAYLLYLSIVSVVTVQALVLVGKIIAMRKSNGSTPDPLHHFPKKQDTFDAVLLTIGSSLWSVLYVLFADDYAEFIKTGIIGIDMLPRLFWGLIMLNVAGILAMLAYQGLMALPLYFAQSKLMRLYKLDDENQTMRLLATCSLLSGIGIATFLLVTKYLALLYK